MRRSPVPVAVIVLAALLVGVLAYAVFAKDPGSSLDTAVQRGEKPPAPATMLELPRLGEEGKASVSDLKGQIVFVNIWASWCPPCEDEAPLIRELHAALQQSGEGTVLGVTHQDASKDSLEFAREFGLDFPSIRDVEGEFFDAWGATGPPETYAIDAQGRVAAVARGAVGRDFVRGALKAAGAKATIPAEAAAS